MKRHLLFLALFAAIACFSSCDSKICVCYQPVNGQMTMQDTYTDIQIRCVDLSTSTRVCVEESERVDPGDVAYPFKKK